VFTDEQETFIERFSFLLLKYGKLRQSDAYVVDELKEKIIPIAKMELHRASANSGALCDDLEGSACETALVKTANSRVE
jgi:hypothetical protein